MRVVAHTEISHKMFSDFGRRRVTEINLAFDFQAVVVWALRRWILGAGVSYRTANF